jgi:type IX secretion system PorP/SprF family membrane protein
LSPNIIYQYQNGFQELNIGAYLKYENFTVGAWYRNRDAFIMTVGINTDKFKVGYSYDLTLSKLGINNTQGAHELSLVYEIAKKHKRNKRVLVTCPKF